MSLAGVGQAATVDRGSHWVVCTRWVIGTRCNLCDITCERFATARISDRHAGRRHGGPGVVVGTPPANTVGVPHINTATPHSHALSVACDSVAATAVNRSPAPIERVVPAKDSFTVVVHSGDLDKVLAALTIGVGAASMGTDTHMVFAFWAASALRKKRASKAKRSLMERMFGWLLPSSAGRLRLSRLDMFGLGTFVMQRRMKARGMLSVEENLAIAAELGVRIYICEVSLDILGLTLDDLIEYPDLQACGVATLVDRAMSDRQMLFI